jgi:hypothetical protein
MKRFLLLMVPLVTSVFAQKAVHIPILNSQFNEDALACSTPGSNCFAYGITGWLAGPETGVSLESTIQFPSVPPEGLYVAYLGYPPSTGSISQMLGVPLQANTTYILTVRVGARADFPFTGYFAALGAGNTTLASSNSATPLGGKFVDDVIVYNSGANPPQLGQSLQIVIKSLGTGQVSIANVSLTAAAQ